MKIALSFLEDLSRNNNREWFQANRDRYQESLGLFRQLAANLLEGITAFDPSLGGQEAKDSIFRIYKDVRFSKDKLPYKTHFGCWMTRGGRKSTDAGYYFHLEPGEKDLRSCTVCRRRSASSTPCAVRRSSRDLPSGERRKVRASSVGRNSSSFTVLQLAKSVGRRYNRLAAWGSVGTGRRA